MTASARDDARVLNRFAVEPLGDGGFLLTLEDGAGVAHRFVAGEEQMDVLADLIDDALGTASED